MSDRADARIVRFLARNQYHPRSSTHGDAMCLYLLDDLMESCPSFSRAAKSGNIVYMLNYTIDPSSPDRWNTDLVVGPPHTAPTTNFIADTIQKDVPREVWLAVDAKTIMTEHGKARRNRQRDLNSFQDLLHRKNANTVVGGLLILNIATRFLSPLARTEEGVTIHRNVERLVAETITLMEGIPRAGNGQTGLEALGIVVVNHTNIVGEPTTLATLPPAPQVGDPLNYTTFVNDLCIQFTRRNV
jgi:hypothetical protein